MALWIVDVRPMEMVFMRFVVGGWEQLTVCSSYLISTLPEPVALSKITTQDLGTNQILPYKGDQSEGLEVCVDGREA